MQFKQLSCLLAGIAASAGIAGAPAPEKDFRLEFDYDGARFAADTREYRAVLGEEISLAEPEVLAFITGQVAEGIAECCPAPEKL